MTPSNTTAREREPVNELPDGMIDWHARCAVRDLVRVYGLEEARQLVAMYLNDEAERRRH